MSAEGSANREPPMDLEAAGKRSKRGAGLALLPVATGNAGRVWEGGFSAFHRRP